MTRFIVLGLLLSAACGGDDEPSADAGSPRDSTVEFDGSTGSDTGPGIDAGPRPDGATEPGWRTDTPLPVRVQEISAAVIDGRVWIAGGFEAGSTDPVATVRIYDPIADSWSTGPALPQPRHHLMLAAVGSDLYAIGGMGAGWEPLDVAWVLRGAAGDWEPITALLEARGAGTAGVIGGKIYVAGGQTRGGLASDTLAYDPAMDSWERLAPIPTEREHLAGFVHDGELWAVGGRRLSLSTNTDVVEIYDPVADAWRDGPSLLTARGGFGGAVLDGVAYVIGGEQPDRALHEAEALDLPSGTWRAIDRVPTPRHGHAVAAANGRVYVIGGADEPIFAAVDAVESYAP